MGEWEHASATLVTLEVDIDALRQIMYYCGDYELPHYSFLEPDLNFALTAVALFPDKYLKGRLQQLPLLLKGGEISG